MIRALVDTGCTTTIADPRIVSTMSQNNEHIIAVDGSAVMCSVGSLRLSIAGHDVNTQCLVLSSNLEQFKLVIGMDIIQQLRGVTITKTGHAEFKQFSIKQTLGVVSVHTATVLLIDDVDFYSKFDGNNWTIQWKWAGMEPELHNKLSSYKIDDNARVDFDAEVQSWVDEGILQAVPRDCYVEIDGVIVEDGAWMRKKDDNAHINLSELDAILKGVNMALKWSVSDINIKTDSATVYGWLNSSLYSTHTIKTKGMNEMLVKRRLGVLRDLCSEYKLTLSVQWVCSDKNKADYLTRVPKRWIDASAKKSTGCVSIKAIHDVHHLGIDRTHYLAKLEDPEVTRGKVADVINYCMQCQSIDPAPQNWDKGHLSAIDNWRRLAVDVTHYNRVCYLTCVDCGPSRFAIWRRIHDESAPSIVAELEMIIRERGPPEQILMDNGLSFRSTAIRKLLDKWHIQGIYRCAYRAEGNGVVERNHRTIKRMAARSNNSVLDMVHWYNTTPKYGTNSCTTPAAMTYKYSWRVPTSSKESTIAIEDVDNRYKIGDEVFVKPPVSRCTTPWGKGVVTEINSDNNVEVNGIPRHVADLRRVPDIQAHEAAGNPDPGDDINIVPVAEPVPRVEARPQRERRPPERHGNNIYDG